MNRQKFEEHYKRYANHLQSVELERKLLKSSQEKTKHLAAMAVVAEKRGKYQTVSTTFTDVYQFLVDKAIHRSNTVPSSEKKICTVSSEDFLADIICTLIYSRHILAISYVISYFI